MVVAAPARHISGAEAAPFFQLLEQEGFCPLATPHLYGSCHQFSGTDAERAADFQWALDAPEVKAIFCARGGYGGLRITDALDSKEFIKHPKWICGYSDTTVFHQLMQHWGYPSLHCTMPVNVGRENLESLSVRSMLAALMGEPLRYEVQPHPLNRPGKAQGALCGGNLSILYALQGSPTALRAEGKILFIEDLDEYLYHIDRMMLNLKRSGALANLAGLVVGNLSDMHDNAVPFGKTAEEIVYEHVAEYDYPVCFGFPAGHADASNNMALPMGMPARMEVDATGSSLRIG